MRASDLTRVTVPALRGWRALARLLRSRRLRALAGEGGITLVELVVSMVILSIVLGALSAAMVSGIRSEADLNARFQAQEQGRLALDKIRRELHCASAVTEAGGSALSTTAATGIVVTLPSNCATAGGATYVAWCTRTSGSQWKLWRTPVASSTASCPGTGGISWAARLVDGTPFSLPTSEPSTTHLPLVHVDLKIDVHQWSSVGTYDLNDDIALRNASRA